MMNSNLLNPSSTSEYKSMHRICISRRTGPIELSFFSRPFSPCLVSREQKGPSWQQQQQQQQQQQWGGLLEPIGRMTRRRKESRKRVTLQLARWNLEPANAGVGLVCAVLLLPTRPEMPAPPVARDAVLLAPPNQRSHSTLPVTHSINQSITAGLAPLATLTLSVAATCRLQRGSSLATAPLRSSCASAG